MAQAGLARPRAWPGLQLGGQPRASSQQPGGKLCLSPASRCFVQPGRPPVPRPFTCHSPAARPPRALPPAPLPAFPTSGLTHGLQHK